MANEDNKNIQFTGDPVAFDGVDGKRDPKVGKGRFDLIPTEVYYPLFSKADHDWLLDCHPAAIMMSIADEKFIEAIIKMTIYSYSDHMENYAASSSDFWPCVWPMLQDLAIHFQKGAEHYGERNCQKGIPLWSFKDSAMRHAAQTFEGKEDEPHKISVIWNLWMAQWTVMQEKEKEGECTPLAAEGLRLLGMRIRTPEEIEAAKSATPAEQPADALSNSALCDDLKDAVENLREVRKKLKTERFNYMSDSVQYTSITQSLDDLKKVINMLYSIAETTGIPIVTAVQRCDQEQRAKLKKFCIRMRDKMMKLNFEFGGGKDKWDKLIDEMAENAKEAGIPWPPKEPEVVPENKPTLKRDKKTVKVTMSADNIDEGTEFAKWPFTTKEVLGEAIARLNGISIQEYSVKKKLADNCKSEIQELRKLVEVIDKDVFDKAGACCNYATLSRTISMDVLLREILQRLDLINCNTKHVKQAFVSKYQDTMTKITQRMDAIKRGAVGPIETKQDDQIGGELVPIPDSWKQKREEKKAGMMKCIYVQKLRQLAEAYDRIKDLLTEINEAIDADDFRKAREFVKEFNGYNQDFIKVWNQIADKADMGDQTKQ